MTSKAIELTKFYERLNNLNPESDKYDEVYKEFKSYIKSIEWISKNENAKNK